LVLPVQLMPQSPSRSSVQIDVGEATQPAHVLDPDAPLRILVLGDFSGREQHDERTALAGRRTVRVDCDNFDDVMRQMDVRLDLPRVSLRFGELEDFHPDRLYRAAPLFEQLENLRPAAARQQAAPRGGLLEEMIGQTESRAARAEDAGDLAAFIERVSAKHLDDRPDAAKQAWKEKVTAAAAEQMNAILHHPQFQALEAAWRSLSMLVMRLGAEEGIEIAICDVRIEELTADPNVFAVWLAGAKQPWGLVVANYAFGQQAEDSRRLAILGAGARAAGAPLLAEALPPAADEPEAWHALRQSGEARWIGLALPRFLVRLPYGKSTSPVEALEFEEMPKSAHSDYLWGNPAFCCALLIGHAFRSHGWNMRPGIHRRIDGMPLHVYRADGESVSKPCAEVLLTESDAESLLEQGFMPLASLKDQDAVLLVRFCSIAEPAAALPGPWNG
jgi:type VI secretion system protein ImpC